MFRGTQIGCKKREKNVLDYPRKAPSAVDVGGVRALLF